MPCFAANSSCNSFGVTKRPVVEVPVVNSELDIASYVVSVNFASAGTVLFNEYVIAVTTPFASTYTPFVPEPTFVFAVWVTAVLASCFNPNLASTYALLVTVEPSELAARASPGATATSAKIENLPKYLKKCMISSLFLAIFTPSCEHYSTNAHPHPRTFLMPTI